MQICLRRTTFHIDEAHYQKEWEYVASGLWEPETFDILDSFVKTGDIVLDLGAWAGPISLYSSARASMVYAIEPDPVMFAELERNVSLNPELSGKIKCRKVAFSDQDEQLSLFARKKYGESSSSLMRRINDGLASEVVNGVTFETFIEQEGIAKIDFIKMDIEGGEFKLIPSMEVGLKKMGNPTLFVSFHYQHLNEHQYQLHVKNTVLSKILMKLERWFGFGMFKKLNKKAIIKVLASLEAYQFVYTDKGRALSFKQLLAKPFLIKKDNLVFSNFDWKF